MEVVVVKVIVKAIVKVVEVVVLVLPRGTAIII
jgi:hypothetical protein